MVPLMWVKQCHKPPMTGNGKHSTYNNGDDWADWGMVYNYHGCLCIIWGYHIFRQTQGILYITWIYMFFFFKSYYHGFRFKHVHVCFSRHFLVLLYIENPSKWIVFMTNCARCVFLQWCWIPHHYYEYIYISIYKHLWHVYRRHVCTHHSYDCI